MTQTTLPPGMLDRVRALLAKAESTTHEPEAEAFTAKAQELMARYRIERALVDAEHDGGGEPDTRVVVVPSPYAKSKAFLLGSIARANGCRCVWASHEGTATLVGFPDELAATEELFTSCLVQATTALQREGSKQDRWGRSRTVRFRRTFLVAFAVRIGQRLAEAVEDVVADASERAGTELVPLLQAREEATRATVERLFPDLGTFAPTPSDRDGWRAGTAFGDRADLGFGGPRLPSTGRPGR